MWAIMVVLQLMFPRDSLSSMVSLLSLDWRSHNRYHNQSSDASAGAKS